MPRLFYAPQTSECLDCFEKFQTGYIRQFPILLIFICRRLHPIAKILIQADSFFSTYRMATTIIMKLDNKMVGNINYLYIYRTT